MTQIKKERERERERENRGGGGGVGKREEKGGEKKDIEELM